MTSTCGPTDPRERDRLLGSGRGEGHCFWLEVPTNIGYCKMAGAIRFINRSQIVLDQDLGAEAAVEGKAKIDYPESGFSWSLSAPFANRLQRGRSSLSASDA